MKQGLLLILLTIIQLNISSLASTNFITCKSTYALCTTAVCQPVQGKRGLVACNCEVKTGYSAGQKHCQEVKHTRQGQLIFSRYYPIKSYMICSNKRPWAWCLDKPCLIDKNHPNQATCYCSLVENLGSYIIVTDTYHPSACTTGIISSATVIQSNQITEYLQTQKNLQPFPISVIHEPRQ